MRYPEFLKENGSVGFIAPSFGCAQEPYNTLFNNTISKIEAKGYKTILGPNCRLEVGQGKSNTPEKCGKEVNEFFINNRSDVIISCGGGETMCEDLPFIDFDKIKQASPKWYMGYSDNTNLTFMLNTLCDTASIYGPCAGSFGMEADPEYVRDAWELINGNKLTFHNYDYWYLEPKMCGIELAMDATSFKVGEEDEYKLGLNKCELDVAYINVKQYIVMPYKQRLYNGEKLVNELELSGRLIGGCLDCLANIVGTSFDKVSDFVEKYKDDGIIWFLEACDLNVMSIRRALWQLENAGWFKYTKGFMFGRPLHYNDTFGDFDRMDAVVGILGKYNLPIILDMDLGHLSPAIPIVSGAVGKICAKDNEFTIDYQLI